MMIEQGSLEWKQLRMGNVTASRVADVIAKTKSGYSTSRDNYMTELVIERFGVMAESFTNAAMEHGTNTEPLARAAYELKNGVMVQEVDYVPHKAVKRSGASPDGIVGEGLLEIKCPNSKTHFDYLLAGLVPEKYKPQMAWQMACTGAKWCDFVSFDNRVPEGLQYFQIRYERDDIYIGMLEKEIEQFLIEVEAKYQALEQKLNQMKEAA
jgi:putative phage-type endonuclease